MIYWMIPGLATPLPTSCAWHVANTSQNADFNDVTADGACGRRSAGRPARQRRLCRPRAHGGGKGPFARRDGGGARRGRAERRCGALAGGADRPQKAAVAAAAGAAGGGHLFSFILCNFLLLQHGCCRAMCAECLSAVEAWRATKEAEPRTRKSKLATGSHIPQGAAADARHGRAH